jgi:hypothetical protein
MFGLITQGLELEFSRQHRPESRGIEGTFATEKVLPKLRYVQRTEGLQYGQAEQIH